VVLQRVRSTRTGLRTAAKALLAGLIGAIVGIAAYSISQTGGQLLSIVVGGLVGVAAVLGADLYRRSVQLTEVRLVLPGSEMTFQANTDMRQAAQLMFFQAATRVATRPLDDGSGNLREALTSLKTLFDLYREPLESGTAPPPPAKGDSVHELVLDILNFELAPFLAEWHPRLSAFEEAHPGRSESEWPETPCSARSCAHSSGTYDRTSSASARSRGCVTPSAICAVPSGTRRTAVAPYHHSRPPLRVQSRDRTDRGVPAGPARCRIMVL
jgi:hypothetical protein